jgi:cobyrinic acid a,c-diamide synthase
MATSSARLIIAGLSGDAGKTIATLSLLAASRQRGRTVCVFKKGPDYIDPAWLSRAGETTCRSLDTYMVDPDRVVRSFVTQADRSGADLAVIEGNRGLYDGRDVAGTHSTAELAKRLRAPVVLVVNARKTTRTVAAIIKGCVDFDPEVKIAGVILNRVAGERHLRVLGESIAEYTGLPVLGAIPKLGDDAVLIPGRHLGLVPPSEFAFGDDLRTRLETIAANHLDVDGLIRIADAAGPIAPEERAPTRTATAATRAARVNIGYFRDSVFTFYYPENLEALVAAGARLVPVSSLADTGLPDLDALYIGGGFPETHAEALTRNRAMMRSVRRAAEDGLPIYAECGGLIYLARSIHFRDTVYPMAGLFPVDLSMRSRPVGHGYTSVRVDTANPFYAVGATIRGHEFHYSGVDGDESGLTTCFDVECGVGLGGGRDGLVHLNTLACYTHVHADGVETWAPSIVSRAADHAAKRRAPGGIRPRPGTVSDLTGDGPVPGTTNIDTAAIG